MHQVTVLIAATTASPVEYMVDSLNEKGPGSTRAGAARPGRVVGLLGQIDLGTVVVFVVEGFGVFLFFLVVFELLGVLVTQSGFGLR